MRLWLLLFPSVCQFPGLLRVVEALEHCHMPVDDNVYGLPMCHACIVPPVGRSIKRCACATSTVNAFPCENAQYILPSNFFLMRVINYHSLIHSRNQMKTTTKHPAYSPQFSRRERHPPTVGGKTNMSGSFPQLLGVKLKWITCTALWRCERGNAFYSPPPPPRPSWYNIMMCDANSKHWARQWSYYIQLCP